MKFLQRETTFRYPTPIPKTWQLVTNKPFSQRVGLTVALN